MQRRINDECQQTRKKRVTFRETVEEIYGTTTEIVHMSNTSSGRRQRLERSSSSIRELQQLQEIAVAIENLAAPNSRQRHDSSAGDSEHGEILMAINQLQQQISEIDAKFEYLCRELKREVENVQTGTTIQLEHILGRIAQLERVQAFKSSTPPSVEFVRNGNNASTPLADVRNNGYPLNGIYNPSPIISDQRVQQPNDGVMNGTYNPSPIISDQRVQQPNDGVMNGTYNPSPIISDQRVQQPNDGVMNGTYNPSPIISDQRVQQPNDGVMNGTYNPSPIISDQRVQQPNDGVMNGTYNPSPIISDQRVQQPNDRVINGTYNPSPIISDQRVQQPNDGLFAIHLKNCWDKYACHIGLKILGTDYLTIRKTDQSVDWSYVFSTCPVPTGGSAGIFYFEVDIYHMLSCFTIGLATKQMPLAPQLAVPAHNASSAAASAPDGTTTHLFGGTDHFLLMISMSSIKPPRQQGPTTTKSTTTEFLCSDIVGFGIELANGRIIVTKNGRRLDIADLYFSAAQPLFPFVSLRDFGATIEANFGPNFKFKP
ncbi:hypothetical protein niasHT_022734 [Heterodera trifolii]|uniref:B30.2/SPRY domain-containing protein n=1 Tax=Heterodera trifolii TaxID=157864 RepID=A0ABD2K645_9BILA